MYLQDIAPAVAEEAWGRFLAALEPLRQAAKPGAILLHFPPWFHIGRARQNYILACAPRTWPSSACTATPEKGTAATQAYRSAALRSAMRGARIDGL